MSVSLKSQLAPKGLEFKPAEIIIGDKYCAAMTVISYPKAISEGYLSNLTQISGIKICIKHIPIDFSVLSRMLNKEINEMMQIAVLKYSFVKMYFPRIICWSTQCCKLSVCITIDC